MSRKRNPLTSRLSRRAHFDLRSSKSSAVQGMHFHNDVSEVVAGGALFDCVAQSAFFVRAADLTRRFNLEFY